MSARTVDQLDTIQSAKILGVSCTALALYPGYVNAHKARKIILRRDDAEVRQAMEASGFPNFQPFDLSKINGIHVDWQEVFERPRPIYEYLLDRPFDAERHYELRQMNVQVDYERVVIGKQAAQQYQQAILRGLN